MPLDDYETAREPSEADPRARAVYRGRIDPEAFSKELGAGISTTGNYDLDEESVVVAEAPVTQKQLEAALKKYRFVERPELKPPTHPEVSADPSTDSDGDTRA